MGEIFGFHYDADANFEAAGILRVHIPITTNPKSRIFIGNRFFHFVPGQIWVGDFSMPHFFYNAGDTPWTHLLFDVNATEHTVMVGSDFGQKLLEVYSAMRADVAGARSTYGEIARQTQMKYPWEIIPHCNEEP